MNANGAGKNSSQQNGNKSFVVKIVQMLFIDSLEQKKEGIKVEKLTFIKESFTMNTGGDCMVDFLTLTDGKVIGVNDECIVLYPSMDAFMSGEGSVEIIEIPID